MKDIVNYKNIVIKILKHLLVGVVSIGLVLLFMRFVAFHAYVPSESMVPTINVGDHYIVSRISYLKKAPQRGDIITFKNTSQINDDEDVHLLVKRVIGVGGDIVKINNGNVYINDVLLEEKYAEKDNYTGTFVVPEGCYFVMGDNRDESYDARYWDNPFIKRSDIVGKGVFRIYPHPKKLV